jgi:hypothetical protein
MGRFIEGVDRAEATLFPECLEDWSQNRAAGHRIPIHLLGSPSRLPAIPDKLLIAISESRRPLPK